VRWKTVHRRADTGNALSQSFADTFTGSRICRRNFDDIYHTGDINTSGLGGHISISGCRSSSKLLSLNSPWPILPDLRQ